MGLLRGKRKIMPDEFEVDFGIVVTAYKDLEVCKTLLQHAERIQYPHYHIYIVADQVPATSVFDKIEKVTIIYPSSPLNSKVKSIKLGIGSFLRNHNYTLILDPDNVLLPGTLEEMARYIKAGYKIVQAKRVAKNLDSAAAKLDAIGEAYYNWCREIYFRLGNFVTISGSGMAFETQLFKKILEANELNPTDNSVIAGEDKIFQTIASDWGIPIAFANDARVLDEKISDFEKMQRQRTRWLKANIDAKPKALRIFFDGLLRLNPGRLFFGFEELKLPNSFLFLATLLLMLISLVVKPTFTAILGVALIVFICNFLISAWLAGVSTTAFMAIFEFPRLLKAQVLALLSVDQAKKDFLVTEKRKIDI